jgi:hypothetical protein
MTMRRLLAAAVLALVVQRIVLGLGSLPGIPGASTNDFAPVTESEPDRPGWAPFARIVARAGGSAVRTSRPRPQPSGIWLGGCVVDEETGAPIESFALETGRGGEGEPAKTSWDSFARHVPGSYSIVNGTPVMTRNPRGEFGYFADAREVESRGLRWLRIVADGYEPRLVSDRPLSPADDGKAIKLTVRLGRGRPLIGRVVDHTGEPAAGAKLFLIRPSGGEVKVVDDDVGEGSDTGVIDPSVTRAMADEQGRFRITGVGDATALGISAPTLHLWTVPIPKPAPGEEPTIRLPEPATIRIPYAIDGDEPRAEFSVQFLAGGDLGRRLRVFRNLAAPNHGEAVLRDATPGAYSLWRLKSLTIGDYQRRDHVESRTFSVESGGTAVVDFARERGGPIAGEVSGPEGEHARMIFVGIEPADAAATRGWPPQSPRSLLDIAACGEDRRFRTARIPPGEYTVLVVGYRNGPRYGPFIELMEPFDFSGSTHVTVPPEGAPPAVQVVIEGHRRPSRPAAAR